MNFFQLAVKTTTKSIKAHTMLSLLLLVLISYGILSVEAKELKCLTGYKILTRQIKTVAVNQIQTTDNLQQYSLSFRCLCPNDYYGDECSNHKDISCYLYKKQEPKQNTRQNTQQQHIKVGQSKNMKLNVTLGLRCWVKIDNIQQSININQINQQTYKNNRQFVQLNQYLSQHNIDNNFAVQNQFGKNFQIIWANNTTIFDSSGNIIINQDQIDVNSTNDQELRAYIKQKLIGKNQKLSKNPFKYNSFFLNNFGLINGQITYQTSIIKPSKGIVFTQNINNTVISVNNQSIDMYIKQYVDIQTSIEKNRQIFQDFKNKEKQKQFINNKTQKNPKQILELILQEYVANQDSIKKQFSSNLIPFQPGSQEPKNIPIVTLPIEVNILQSAQFQAVRIQLSIINIYQQNLRHVVSLNSPLIRIQLDNNIAVPKMYDMDLTVIQQSGMKTYMQLIILVFVLGTLFLLTRYLYRWYLKLKKHEYLSEELQTHKFQINQQTMLSE